MSVVTLASFEIEGRARGAVRRGLIVAATSNGRTAEGEASPLPGRSSETLEDVREALASLGGVIDPTRAIDPALPPSLRFALSSALRGLVDPTPAHDVACQVLGDDLGSIDLELAALARGAQSFKLKIRSAADTARVVELRRHAPHARIRVDANRAFRDVHDVPWALLREAGVEWIEEPTPNAALLGRDTPVPIALDESLEDDAPRARDAVRGGRIAAIVLKPTMLGADETLALGTEAHAHGVRTIVSHAFESAVGLRAALALAHRLAPDECHGLAPWPGLGSFRRVEEPARAPLV